MVEVTISELSQFRDKVNDYLRADNGTSHLRVAYEEALFPSEFCGKKKYFGVAHINVPNFRPKKLFIRGIDIIKQGQTDFAKEIGRRIMWPAMSIDNTRNILQITEEVLSEAISEPEQWGNEDFVCSDVYKPNKQNPSVQRFYHRMRAKHARELEENCRRMERGEPLAPVLYEPPEPYTRFYYIIVKPDTPTHDARGRKRTLKKGDKMEYVHVVNALGLTIDVGNYLSGKIAGLCARFICGEDAFQPPGSARMDPKSADKSAVDAAKKHIIKFMGNINGVSPEMLRTRGHAYRRAHKNAMIESVKPLRKKLGTASSLLLDNAEEFLNSEVEGDPTRQFVEVVASAAKEDAQKTLEYFGDYEQLLELLSIDPKSGVDLSEGVPAGEAPPTAARLFRLRPTSPQALTYYNREEFRLRQAIGELHTGVLGASLSLEEYVGKSIVRWRQLEHEHDPEKLGEFDRVACGVGDSDPGASTSEPVEPIFAEEDVAALKALETTRTRLVGVLVARGRMHALEKHIRNLREKRTRNLVRPDDFGSPKFSPLGGNAPRF